MERIDVTELISQRNPTEAEHFLEFFLVSYLAQAAIPTEPDAAGHHWVEVSLTINGREVKLADFVTRIMAQFDEHVQSRAAALCESRLLGLEDTVAAVFGELRQKLGLLPGAD